MSGPRVALLLLFVATCLAAFPNRHAGAAEAPTITVGSKNFGESYLLAEVMAQLLESEGYRVERRFGLGGTLICTSALDEGEIDVYPEYTGTITQAILEAPLPGTREAIAGPLAALGLATLAEFGFDNTYAIAMPAELARERGFERISDLAGAADLRLAFSLEFLDRDDGWAGLAPRYGLDQTPVGIEHGLAYRALASGRADATDAYSTDGDIERYGLVLLDDDAGFFPRYAALPLVRSGFPAPAAEIIERLGGRIDEARMRALNARVSVDGDDFATVAAAFLLEEGLVDAPAADVPARGRGAERLENMRRHLWLTGVALGLAVVLGVPLGIVVHRSRRASRVVLYAASLLQTVPSIALLALLIPLLGIGWLPAIVALFLYSLLPILRATVTALLTVDPLLRQVAVGMGLTRGEQVRHLLLPLAMPNVLAGIRTAAVISIGTATLAAFIGAGGLGQPIVTGLALNDTGLILEGAVPAAVLAIATELLFEALERWLVPAHLRAEQI